MRKASMLSNEKGFIYPLTLCLMILFSTVLAISIEHYLNEKRMLTETMTIVKQDYYLLKTVQTLESSLAANESISTTGSFEFDDGHADYSISELTSSLWEITIHLKTGSATEISGFAYYDKDLQRMIKWI